MATPTRSLSSTALTDDQLGRQALGGDRAAFTELFTRHEAGLFNVAFRLTGDREDAADITQEAFLRVFARLDDLAGREVNLAAYLHRTARNLVYDRSAQRARETPSDQMERAAGADETLEADPQLSALVAGQGADVRAANARLPERHRLALALRELEDMSYQDIGRVLDITAGAVAQLLLRARLALRRELRLGQVDVEAMDPGCRARLGEIGALIDGELGPDRAHVLSQHLALCPACRSARASFEQARVTYRAWLPLPILGLGAATARAAEGRALVRFSDTGRRSAGAARATGAGAGGFLAGRRRAGAMVGSGLVGALLLFGAPTLVAIRSGSSAPPAPSAPLARVPVATAAAAAATTTTGPGVTAPAAVTNTAPSGPLTAAPAAIAIADPTSTPGPLPTFTIRPRTTRVAPPPPVSVAPSVTSAGGVTTTTTAAPPVTTTAATQPAAPLPAAPDVPPATTTTTATDPTRPTPPVTTTDTTPTRPIPPIDVPPGRF